MQLSRSLILEGHLSARRAKTFCHNSAEIPVAIDSRYREEATEREDAFFGRRQRVSLGKFRGKAGFLLRHVDANANGLRRLTRSPDEGTLRIALASSVVCTARTPRGVPNSSKRQCGSSRLKSR